MKKENRNLFHGREQEGANESTTGLTAAEVTMDLPPDNLLILLFFWPSVFYSSTSQAGTKQEKINSFCFFIKQIKTSLKLADDEKLRFNVVGFYFRTCNEILPDSFVILRALVPRLINVLLYCRVSQI